MGSSSSSIRRSYLLALAAVAALTLAAQWAVQDALDRAEGDASVINLAGRQRMLSQKLTKAALSTEFIPDEQVRASSSEELSRALERLSSSHVELADAASGDPRTASQYARVDVLFGQLLDAAEAVRSTEPGSRGQQLAELSRAEAAFLPEMNALVGDFESVADGRILRLRRVELALLLATLLVLTLEAFLIFEPLRRALTQRVDELTEARDVAERATRAQDEFLSAMSHEIRTPLNGVIGMSELLLESELSPQQMELAITCNQSSKVLLALVNDVLDHAKLESGEAELEIIDVQPEELLVEVAQLVAPKLSGTTVELIVDGPREPDLNVQADPLRLRQVLINLASNAVKFTSEGHVLLRWKLEPREGLHPWLIFEVQDTGIGIAPDRREAIFDRFTQADPSTSREFGGTGLGLSLCREWVDRMEGDIQFESQLGEGSLFRVRIPLPSAPVGVVPERTGIARNRRVAIVLESPEQRAAQTRLLGQLGAEVLEFSTLEGLAGLPSEELGRLDAAVVDRCFLDDSQTAARYPVGLAPQRVLALNRAGDPLDLPQALRGDGVREPIAGVLYRPVRRSSLASSLSDLWSEPVDQARAALPGKGEERLAGLKVLAVEDNPVNRRLLEAHLKHLGCEFTFACDGVEALERAEQADFGLVLMDCQMPRMDGYAASSKLREMPQGRDVVILALSANTLPEHARKCEAAGIDDWLGKPYTREDLREILLRWIERAPTRGVSPPKAQGA